MVRIKPGMDEDVALGFVVQGQGLEEADVVLNEGMILRVAPDRVSAAVGEPLLYAVVFYGLNGNVLMVPQKGNGSVLDKGLDEPDCLVTQGWQIGLFVAAALNNFSEQTAPRTGHVPWVAPSVTSLIFAKLSWPPHLFGSSGSNLEDLGLSTLTAITMPLSNATGDDSLPSKSANHQIWYFELPIIIDHCHLLTTVHCHFL
ncbi:hypothetical protein CEB3_c19890 [Peptococcaceae bacterium CEB3]|nr:hypothetical protein CEB3_c19890 [Peptococcaceae bacterium CEB3]